MSAGEIILSPADIAPYPVLKTPSLTWCIPVAGIFLNQQWLGFKILNFGFLFIKI